MRNDSLRNRTLARVAVIVVSLVVAAVTFFSSPDDSAPIVTCDSDRVAPISESARPAISASIDSLQTAFGEYGIANARTTIPIAVRTGGDLRVAGWIFETQHHALVRGVTARLGDDWYRATTALPRPDVAAAFGDDRLKNSGFCARFRASGAGTTTVALYATLANGRVVRFFTRRVETIAGTADRP